VSDLFFRVGWLLVGGGVIFSDGFRGRRGKFAGGLFSARAIWLFLRRGGYLLSD